MQLEPDFRFDMDDIFNMCSQSMACPSTSSASFSSGSSVPDPFTLSSRRSTPNQLTIDLEAACAYNPGKYMELTPPSTSMSKYSMGPIKQEPEHMSFSESLPTTPMKKMDSFSTQYDLLDMGINAQAMGTMTPSHSFGINTISPEAAIGPTSYMMTPTHSLSGSEIADSSSSWSISNESPTSSFFQQQHKDLCFHDMEQLETERYSQSPMGHLTLQGNDHSANSMRVQRKMMPYEAQRKTSELHRAQIRAPRAKAGKPDSGSVDVVRRAMCKCDYPGCHKAFRRNEHLKRHKQTFHGEGPNRFSCEFCGKDQFNRQDNLNNHRKLHARPNSRNRGVEFIPAAVPIIELEERSRKRRAPPKSKTAEKQEYDF